MGWKQPTKAHKAIAKLAKAGYVRVILTTNFDRLLEQAFESEGITPQVISYEAAISQATPLVHCQIPTIVKINGDYIDCEFRNTSEELDEYPPTMKQYLKRIFEDYGLITCGWSGEWDKGLINIISESTLPRYNSFCNCWYCKRKHTRFISFKTRRTVVYNWCGRNVFRTLGTSLCLK